MDFKLNWRISIKKSKLKAFKDLFSCLYCFQYIFTRKINKRKKVTNYANSKLSRNRMKQVNKSSLLKIGIFLFLNIVGIILTCCFTNHVTALWPRYVNSRLDFQVHQKHCTFLTAVFHTLKTLKKLEKLHCWNEKCLLYKA